MSDLSHLATTEINIKSLLHKVCKLIEWKFFLLTKRLLLQEGCYISICVQSTDLRTRKSVLDSTFGCLHLGIYTVLVQYVPKVFSYAIVFN